MQQKQISGWVFDDGVLCEDRLLNKFAFDIKVLKDSGAELDENLKFHLEDGVVSDRLEDPNFINERIAAVTPKRCEAELREYLPEEVYRQLAGKEFEPLRQSLRDLFAEWLKQ